MKNGTIFVAAASIGLLFGAGSAFADDEFDNYMEKAAPVMHYSCASLSEEAGDDTDQMLHAVRMMVAVSLHNRNIDLTTYDLDDAKKAEIKAKFLSMLEEGCANDSNALLAGIVDASVHQLVGDK
jgi:hypothetical protein